MYGDARRGNLDDAVMLAVYTEDMCSVPLQLLDCVPIRDLSGNVHLLLEASVTEALSIICIVIILRQASRELINS